MKKKKKKIKKNKNKKKEKKIKLYKCTSIQHESKKAQYIYNVYIYVNIFQLIREFEFAIFIIYSMYVSGILESKCVC
jgi:hypothetical protein